MDLNLNGRLKLNVFKHINGDKILIDEFEDNNLIVLSGKQILTFLLAGEPGNHRITKCGVGENPITPYFDDTGLTNPFIKNVDGYTLLEPTVVQWNFSIAPSEAVGLNIAEYGLFSTDGQIFARKVRVPVIPKDNSISFSGDWTVWLVECKKINFSSYPTISWDVISAYGQDVIFNNPSNIQTDILSNIRTERHFSSTANVQHSVTTDIYRYDQFVGGDIAEPGTDTFESVDSGDDMYI